MASSQGSFYAIPVRADANKTVQFVFEEPTVRGFGFVLGDVDAENVFLKAYVDEGMELTGAQLGFQASFNYESKTDAPE